MNLQVRNRIRKALTYAVTGIFFLLISAFLILQIPAVQEFFIKRYLGNFSKVTGFTSKVGAFQLLWFDRLELQNLEVTDPANNKMIAVETLIINFKLSQLFQQRDVNVDGIFVEGAQVYLTRINENDTSRNLNINVFVNRINEAYGSTSSTGRSPRINIGEAILNQSQFTYFDQDKEPIKKGFNYNQFVVDIDESQLQNFMILGDTTEFNVNTLLATDRDTKFPIRQMSTFFRLSQQSMEFVGLNLHAGKSVISDTILFNFNGQEELSEFVSKVKIDANLDNTIIYPEDLALFAPGAEKLTEPVYLKGKFDGKVNDFRFREMEIGTGKSIFRGSMDMEGLPDINETFIVLKLKNSKVDFHDFSFLLREEAMQRLTPMGRLNLEGEFLGYPTDFVAKGDFAGKLGRITSDINFKVNEENFNLSVYSGKIALNNFDLGTYLNDTTNFQKVSLTGNVKGSGLTFKTADFNLNGKINAVGIRKYTYKNITTNARFASQLFNGFIKINDPNLQFSARGSVDLREGVNTIKLQAQLDTAFLQNLKITDKNVFVHSHINVDIKGLHIDSIAGKADLEDFRILYNDKWLSLKEIHLNAERSANERKLSIQTNLLNGDIRGNFLLSDISYDLQTLVREIILNIRNDKKAIADYYAEKSYRPKTYQAKFNLELVDIGPIVNLINTDLSLAKKTKVEGRFSSGYTSILQVFSDVDSITFNKTLLLGTGVELNASKIADSTSVLAMLSVNSDKQILSKNFSTKNIIAEAIWNKSHIDFAFDAEQDEASNYVQLKGAVDFFKDSTQLKVLPSTLKVLEKIWEFDENNYITLAGENIKVRNLTMRNEAQFISASGIVSRDPDDKLSLLVHDFDLSMLNPVTGRDMSGTLNALFDVSNYYVDPFIENDLSIDSLTVDNFLIGDIRGKNQWDTVENKFLLNFFVDRQETRIVNLNGSYNPRNAQSPLDVDAKLTKANLRILQPFIEDIFSNIGGTVTGDFKIRGVLNEPAINGEGQITDGEVMINYLKTTYKFSGTAGMTPRSIYFRDIELSDLFNNKAKLNGALSHRNFYSMRVNIDASFENFQVLNTTAKDNSLFYGQGYATGDLNIFGSVANLKITANARTDRNTRFYIPIGGDSEVERKEFIKFVSFSDSTFQKSLVEEINNKVDLTGITLDFNLDVTPDAYCEIIFDLKAGDIIRGRGNGELQLQFDTKGEFNMFGPFEFTEGYYNFTLYDIINKDFEIKKGSRITWYGDAYEGVLDISASYNQLASFLPLLSPELQKTASPQMKRKYPAQVILELDGPMLSPQINFDILAIDLPQNVLSNDNQVVRLDFEFESFKNRMDEQELKRQVFSLIVLRRFSPPDAFNTSGSIANSVSELLSNQLSNWVSQVDENLEIDLDLSGFDDEAFNTLQMRLRYSVGRWVITRDATTTLNSSTQTTNPGATPAQQNNLATLAGDWTVEYLLTADGKLKVKMYNRSNINPILSSITNQNTVTTGVSILHTQNFNELKDLWKSARKRKEEEPQQEEPDPDADANEEAVKNEEDGSE